MVISVKIGIGELFDRLSILEIKMKEIKDEHKLENVKKEYDYTTELVNSLDKKETTDELYEVLYSINYMLWNIEDEIRLCEKQKIFDEKFITLARQVYMINDKRAKVKKEINVLYNSDFIEEKSYQPY
jgi:hypothetical protein